MLDYLFFFIKICSNQHADLLKFLFIEDSLKIKKAVFFIEFFDKKILFSNI